MKAIIYCRKSTDDDKNQKQSLDIQLDWAISYAEKHNIEVIETIIESKSAYKINNRDGFNKMTDLFMDGVADTLLVYQLDRIARNPIDEGTIKQLAIQKNIKTIHSAQGTFDGKQIITLSLFLAMANQYSIDHSERVINGKKKKVENGGISWRAPLGYYNDRNDNGKAKFSDDSVYIKRIFEMKAEGHPVSLIVSQIYSEGFRTKKGLKVGKTVIDRILKNPFYYGMIVYKNELFKGIHKPVISKELFDKANSFGRGITIIKHKELSPLKGKIKHLESDLTMGCCLIKKKYVYFYIHSSKKVAKLRYKQDLLIEHFDEEIDNYCIPEEFKESVKEGIFQEIGSEIDFNKKQASLLSKKIKQLENEEESLRLMRRRGEITGEEFIKDKNQLLNDIEDLQNKLIKITRQNSEFLDNLEEMAELFVSLKDKRKTYDSTKKINIISNIIAELKIDNQKRLHIEEKPLFKAFRISNQNKWWTHRATIPGPIA